MNLRPPDAGETYYFIAPSVIQDTLNEFKLRADTNDYSTICTLCTNLLQVQCYIDAIGTKEDCTLLKEIVAILEQAPPEVLAQYTVTPNLVQVMREFLTKELELAAQVRLNVLRLNKNRAIHNTLSTSQNPQLFMVA